VTTPDGSPQAKAVSRIGLLLKNGPF